MHMQCEEAVKHNTLLLNAASCLHTTLQNSIQYVVCSTLVFHSKHRQIVDHA